MLLNIVDDRHRWRRCRRHARVCVSWQVPDLTQRVGKLDNHRPPTRTTRAGAEVGPARSIRAVRRATERGWERQQGFAEGHMLGIVRCRFEAEQRTDEAGDVRNGAGSLTPTAYRDRAEADTPHHLLRLQSHEEDSVGTASWRSSCLPSWPRYGGATRAECQRRSPVESPYATAVRRCGEQSQVDGSTG